VVVNLVKKWTEIKNYAITAPGAAHAYQVIEEDKKN
jgi:hypothetical protein